MLSISIINYLKVNRASIIIKYSKVKKTFYTEPNVEPQALKQ